MGTTKQLSRTVVAGRHARAGGTVSNWTSLVSVEQCRCEAIWAGIPVPWRTLCVCAGSWRPSPAHRGRGPPRRRTPTDTAWVTVPHPRPMWTRHTDDTTATSGWPWSPSRPASSERCPATAVLDHPTSAAGRALTAAAPSLRAALGSGTEPRSGRTWPPWAGWWPGRRPGAADGALPAVSGPGGPAPARRSVRG